MIKLADQYKIIFKMEDSFAGVSFVEGMGVSGYKDLDFIIIYENKKLEAFLPEKEIQKASDIGFDFCINREKTQKIHQGIKSLLDRVRKMWGELDVIDLSKLDDEELKNLFINYVDLSIKIWSYFSLTEFYYFYKVEDTVQGAIKNKDDQVTLLTSPKRANIITDESFNRIGLALKILKDADKKDGFISDHLDSYDFIPYASGQPRWNSESFSKEIARFLKKPVSGLEYERDEILKSDEELQEKQKQILKKINLPREILNLIDSIKEWQEIKWLLRIFANRTFISTKCLDVKFLREFSKRYKFTISQLSNMYYQETLDLLNGKKLDKEEIQK